MTRTTIALALAAAVALAAPALAAPVGPPAPTAQALTQPLGQHSTLIGFNFAANAKPADGVNIVQDDTFASWVAGAIIKAGVPQVGDATFLFNQCFGGGFLDDLNNQLAGVNWVGGAASRFDQPAYGQALGALNPAMGAASNKSPNPMSYWTTVLSPQLAAGSNNANSINNANVNDPVAALEQGQLAYPAGGGAIPLVNGAAKKYALLWAGYTDAQRHYNNTNAIYNQLTAAGYTVTVLYGNKANQVPLNDNGELNMAAVNAAWNVDVATPANLKNAITNIGAAIQADKAAGKNDDQFLFYATDHGGNTAVVGAGAGGGLIPGAGGPQGTYGTIQISPSMGPGWMGDPNASPTMSIEYNMSQVGSDAQVYFNGLLLGDIFYDPSNPSDAFATLPIPVSDIILGGTNTLSFQTISGPAFTVLDAEFFSGAVNEIQPAPEPACLGLLAVGALMMMRRRR